MKLMFVCRDPNSVDRQTVEYFANEVVNSYTDEVYIGTTKNKLNQIIQEYCKNNSIVFHTVIDPQAFIDKMVVIADNTYKIELK